MATRVSLLEGDADATERKLAAIGERLDKILWAMVGLVISVATACVLLALNLVVNR